MKLTFEYPVYPTKTQETTLLGWFDHLCELQNSARDNRKYAHEEEGRFVSQSEQQALLTVARETYSDFREVPQDFQVSVLKRVDKAFDAFRRRCKAGAKKKGYPRYKMRVRSLTWCLRKHKLKTGERVRQNPIKETDFRYNRLKVPKLGEVKIRMHRPLEGDPKEVTLVKKASGWYAHITCELPDTPKVEPTDAIAVDVGTTHYLTTSEGETEDNPRWYRQAEGLLHKHNQTMARRKKGSKRWYKAVHAVALHHERTANKRKDFIGKLVYKFFHLNLCQEKNKKGTGIPLHAKARSPLPEESDGNLKNLVKKPELELFFSDYARFLSKNAVFKSDNQLRISVSYCVWYTICEKNKRVSYFQLW